MKIRSYEEASAKMKAKIKISKKARIKKRDL